MKPGRYKFLLPAFVCAALTGCESPQELEVRIELLDTPAKHGSQAPQVFSNDNRASLSWLQDEGDGGHGLYYAEWRDAGWSEARHVASGEDWFANWADLPGVRPQPGGGWLAWWLQKSGPGTYAYDVQLSASSDGRQWERLGTPHHDGTQTEHGFVTVFDLTGGGTGLAWLDGRNTAPAGESHVHSAEGDGMTLRYGIFQDGKQQLDAELDGLTCDCCQTDSARAGDAIVLVYRDRSEDEIRDIHAARFVDDGWEQPVLVNADNWEIPGCPVNGPAVDADGDLVAVAWFTAPGGDAQVRLALSHDAGRTFDEPVRIDAGRPDGRVDLILHPQAGVLVSWMEKTVDGAEVRLRRVSREGRADAGKMIVATDAGRATGFPRMALLPDGDLLMTWTETANQARLVRTARIHLD